jgi:hypothetical protein
MPFDGTDERDRRDDYEREHCGLDWWMTVLAPLLAVQLVAAAVTLLAFHAASEAALGTLGWNVITASPDWIAE